METQSKGLAKLTPALIKARGSMDGAVKSAKGNWGQYASLEDLLECCMEHLLENGILLTQPAVDLEGNQFIMTQLTHSSGEFMRSFTQIVVVKEHVPQKALAGQTYARRGGIESILSIPRVDDDGEYGNGSKPKPKPTPKPVTKTTPEIVPEQEDIPIGESQPITEEQRRAFVKQVQTLGVPVETVKTLLAEHGYKTSAEIPQNRYAYFKSRVADIHNRSKQNG